MGQDKLHEIWVIVRSTGEYSDREETPIRFCLSEEDAQKAIDLTTIEAQRDAHLKPVYHSAETHGYMLPDRRFDDTITFMTAREKGATFEPYPDADEISRQNEMRYEEYKAACLSLGHVDPDGSWSGDSYYYAKATIWPDDAGLLS